METSPVVTCFLRNRGAVLLLRRSDAVGSYAGRWGAVAGYAEGDPDAAARREIREETGLAEEVTHVRTGDPFPVEDPALGVRWVVHPYLFDSASRTVELDEESSAHEWVSPTEILRRETVPELWTSYERVAPTVTTVAGDREHGSTYVSVRALEVLRDRAGRLAIDGADGWPEVADLARDLREARPSMAAVRNRVNRAMAAAADRTPAAVETAARAGIDRAFEADDGAARTAADRVAGERLLTLSRSGTVRAAIERAGPASVLVAESRPGGEGVAVAEALAEAGERVTLAPDAALAHLLAEGDVDAAVVGADAVLADGTVHNKVGTRGLALAAAREGVPVYAVAASDKVTTERPPQEAGDPAAVYDGDADLEVAAPTFDATPPDLLAGVCTERGVLDAAGVAAVAEELRELADWEA